ncbi:hypothetical protein BC831DRAFT_141617 [Entophlyctis helioformis]|nr:hypothetical protein BC831DRAFT_141617 [Entophlyctis helioformis]
MLACVCGLCASCERAVRARAVPMHLHSWLASERRHYRHRCCRRVHALVLRAMLTGPSMSCLPAALDDSLARVGGCSHTGCSHTGCVPRPATDVDPHANHARPTTDAGAAGAAGADGADRSEPLNPKARRDATRLARALACRWCLLLKRSNGWAAFAVVIAPWSAPVCHRGAGRAWVEIGWPTD